MGPFERKRKKIRMRNEEDMYQCIEKCRFPNIRQANNSCLQAHANFGRGGEKLEYMKCTGGVVRVDERMRP